MKQLLFLCSTWLVALCCCTACDPVAESDRWIALPQAPTSTQRSVLIEEFTGQNCIHCPKAQALIEKLQTQYGKNRVVAVALHAGPLSLANTATQRGLRSDLATSYYKHWKVQWVPVAHINRGEKLVNQSDWESRVALALQDTTNIALTLHTDYEHSTRRLRTQLNCRTLQGEATGQVQLWLVENNITAPQKNEAGETIDDYLHQHLLRETLNGTWGEAVSLTPENPVQLTHELLISPNYLAENLQVVAFFYNTQGVQQVVVQALYNSQGEQ